MKKIKLVQMNSIRSILLCLIGMTASVNAQFKLIDLHYRNQTSLTGGIINQSLYGGAPIYISASGGIEMDPPQNLVTLTSANYLPAELPFYPPQVSDDDGFASSTTAGLLGYTVPAAWEIFKTQKKSFTYFDFNGKVLPGAWSQPTGQTSFVTFDVSLNAGAVDGPLKCDTKWGNCKIQYNQRFTPELSDTVPNQIYAGQTLAFMLDPRYCHNGNQLPSGWEPFYYIKIGKDLVDYEGLVDSSTRLPDWQVNSVVVKASGALRPAKKVDPDISFSKYGRTHLRFSSKHCNFAGNECWSIRVHPKIDSISSNTGNLDGGQNLVIKGFGLLGNTSVVKVDGIDCEVNPQLSTDTALICETGASTAASITNKPQPGQPGITRSVNTTIPLKDIVTTLETVSYGLEAGKTHIYEGWFKAPESGEYKFYVAADDYIYLWLDSTNAFDPAATVTTTLVEIARMNYNTSWREYYKTPELNDSRGKYQSDWITLEANKFYKLNAKHVDGGGGYHMTASVEFKKANTNNHPLTTQAIQNVRIEHPNTPEQWTLTIVNPGAGQFQLKLKSPKETTTWASEKINANSTAAQLRDLLNNFFQEGARTGSNINVSLVMTDSAGAVTTNAALSKKNVYTIKLSKRITGFSFTSATVVTYGTIAPIITVQDLNHPDSIASSPPLAGSYSLVCPDIDGVAVKLTPSNVVHEWDRGIQVRIEEQFPHLRGKVRVWQSYTGQEADAWKFSYRENGVSFYLIFQGLDYNPAQCYFESDTTNPITGNGTPTFEKEISRPYGGSIMFEPIGLEFLYSNAMSPQVLVTVDDLPAICVKDNCAYAYSVSAAQITSLSYDAVANKVTVIGTSLPTTGLNLSFGGVGNDPLQTTISSTQIEFVLRVKPKAGSHKAEIRDEKGLLPYAAGVTDITIVLEVSSVTPLEVNPLGGDILTITGSGFPVDKKFVTVTFSDLTACEVKTTTPNQITCMVFKMSNSDGLDQNVIVEVLNNRSQMRLRNLGPVTKVKNEVKVVGKKKTLPTVKSVDKTDVSPILKQTLTFIVDEVNFTDELKQNELKVKLLGANKYVRDLYIMSVTSTATLKSFTVKFNGAPVGDYTFDVTSTSHSKYGKLAFPSAFTFKTSSTITGISPTSGSVFGGTLLTITGTNFSTKLDDQAVNIIYSSSIFIGCDIVTATTTQLTCRVKPTGFAATETKSGNSVAVILAAASESKCIGTCTFDFVAPVATITSLTPTFDSATNTIQVSLVGSGFTASINSSVSLFVDNVQQLTTSVNDQTSAVFTIANVETNISRNVQVFFADGSPTGWDTAVAAGLTFTPNFYEIVSGTLTSEGGTLLLVKGTGFGKKTTGLGLYNVTTSKSLCYKVVVTSYGAFTCFTLPLPVSQTNTIKMLIGTTQIACANLDATKCQFSQLAASSPTVTGVTLNGNTIVFTGTGFPLNSDFISKALFKSAEGVITTWTETQATANFEKGVPAALATELAVPRLGFYKTDGSFGVVAFSATSVTLTNTVTVTPNNAPAVSTSFSGGMAYTVTANNIFATLKEPGNGIYICGNLCTLDDTQSDSTKAVCILPSLPTTYSAQNYKIVQSGRLTGNWTGSVQSEVKKITEGDMNTSSYTDPNANCWIEQDFPDTQVGILDQVKIFLFKLNNDKSPFFGVTKLQGFDGVAYVDILTFDINIHEGWNTFEFTSNKPSYQKYKLTGARTGSCGVGKMKLYGIVAQNDPASSTVCTASLKNGATLTDLSSVTYNSSLTPTITSIVPRYGKVSGGESITINGTGFVDGSTTVIIDGKTCTPTSVTATAVVCTTAQRLGDEPNPTFKVNVASKGLAATQGNTFRYVQYWSEASTWGGDAPPQYLEAIVIPKGRTLLVDVDRVPQLSFILVQGALLFAPNSDPTHQRFFDAGYIFIDGGYMEVGTEAFPYTSKITITMHGDVTTPALPTYGNKVIAVRKGELHLVGKQRKVTWTMLDQTAEVGATFITLQAQAGTSGFDWAVGEEIVIASTSYDHNEAETRFITAVGTDSADTTKPKLTLDSPLVFKHYAATETYGTDTIDMRAEVGLLTRNVKYQGDPETSPKNKYGAHIMIHYPEDESCIGRILYTEFFNVGQAFKLGRYPIHFHVIGTVAKSIVKGNAIHQTYNRAVTIHAVSYFNIVNNVIYNTMGHSIFVEDAIETKNVIDHNLVIGTNRSWSLLNTDQTPASFWITHPDNILINNHAAGSDRYGYWYDTQENPINGSYTPTICPVNEKLGEFRDNTAHSNGRYGLRLFHKLVPRTNPCAPWVYDNSNPTAVGSPYPANPAITAKFYNLTSWKNGRAGAIGEEMGAVHWINFKVADNLLAGMEWSFANNQVKEIDTMLIKGGLVIGKSANGETLLDLSEVRGIIGPRWDFFTVRDVKFYNFNFGTSGALGDCSHCFHPAATDSGARTYFTSGLTFDTSVSRKIWYQYPNRGIWHDIDGTLTGKGAGSWATAYFKHNEQPECTNNAAVFDGLTCDNTAQVRRIAFSGMTPNKFRLMLLKIAKYDDSVINALSATAKVAYQSNTANYSSVYMKDKLDPMASWTIPFVTGHKYRIFWDIGQLDYDRMQIDVSQVWKSTDKNVLFNLPITSNFENIDFYGKHSAKFTTDGAGTLFYANDSLYKIQQSSWLAGMNNFDATKKEIDFVINAAVGSSRKVESQTVTCRANNADWCKTLVVVTECVGESKLWSDPNTWITIANPNGTIPKAGEDVLIPSGTIIVYDLETSPVFKLLKIVGCLQFRTDNTKDQHLQAYQIYVQGGKFTIGSEAAPYTKKAKITLWGDFNSAVLTMSGATQQGNKLIANVGDLKFYGVKRSGMSRLQAVANKGATTVYVDPNLDWVAGDELGFAATAIQWTHSEYATIQSYDKPSGELVLTKALSFYHFGAVASTAVDYLGLDMRGEVVLLTRNIVVQGDSTQNDWAGTWFNSDITQMNASGTETKFSGLTILKNVELKNMGQLNNQHAALMFENSNRDAAGQLSSVEGLAIHHSTGWGINIVNSSNISLKNSNIFGAAQIGVNLSTVTNVSGDGVNVFNVARRALILKDNATDKECCVAFCSYINNSDKCVKSTWKNSIVAGCPFAGFIYPGYSCADTAGTSTTHVLTNNVAHSSEGSGLIIYPDPAVVSTKECFQGDGFSGYKNGQASVASFAEVNEVRFSKLISVDNVKGVAFNTGIETDVEKKSILSNSYIYGESATLALDCPDGSGSATGAACSCPEKMGVMSFGATTNSKAKDWHIPSASPRPIFKFKSYATWNSGAYLDNVQFINFKSATTACGSKQTAFAVNEYAADHIPIQNLNAIKFTNVAYDAIIYIYNPPKGWAVIDDCGEWPCTAPSNVIYNFKDAVFEVTDGTTALPSWWTTTTTKQSFQIVANFASAASTYPNSTVNAVWNAWIVRDPAQTSVPQIGQLVWESLDGDKEDRSVQPINITNSDGYKNVINSFMDHMWDGFYTGQMRLSRFNAQILTNKAYTMTYTGTPPKNMRYHLRSDVGTKGITIKVPYPNAGAYSVKTKDAAGVMKIIDLLPIDDATKKPRLINSATATCGVNRFVGIENYLEFFITPGCIILVIPRDAILTSVRMQWTAAEFFAAGGATTFAQRMASVLGIDPSRVKVVSVYEGTVNIVTQILDDPNTQVINSDNTVTSQVTVKSELAALSATLIAVVSNADSTALGAPVLEIQAAVSSNVVTNAVAVTTQLQPGAAIADLAFGLTAAIATLLVAMF